MKKKNAIVTGCAGFIGSNLVDSLLNQNYHVIGIDNLRTGKLKNLRFAKNNKNFKFIKLDLTKQNKLKKIFNNNIDIVFHMAANADVRNGHLKPSNDIKFNTILTFNVLEQMRKNKIKEIVFCSTGSIYGETKQIPTLENTSFPIQTSMYGASKLACEGLLQAYSEAYKIKCYIFRFVSILGPRYSHGHVIDFFKNLKKNNKKLNILGDGNQKKSYLHIYDCLSAIFKVLKYKNNKLVNIYNLGNKNYITVKQSIRIIINELNYNPILKFQKNKRGWIGDVPFILLDTKKIRNLGWKNKYSIKESIIHTLQYLKNEK